MCAVYATWMAGRRVDAGAPKDEGAETLHRRDIAEFGATLAAEGKNHLADVAAAIPRLN
jgi:hypothetical protein